MKKILYLLAITFLALISISCSNDEPAVPQNRNIPQISYTLNVNGDEQFRKITVTVKDRYANVLSDSTFTYVQDCSYTFFNGEQLIINIEDENTFSGSYSIKNNTVNRVQNNTFNGNYELNIYNTLSTI